MAAVQDKAVSGLADNDWFVRNRVLHALRLSLSLTYVKEKGIGCRKNAYELSAPPPPPRRATFETLRLFQSGRIRSLWLRIDYYWLRLAKIGYLIYAVSDMPHLGT